MEQPPDKNEVGDMAKEALAYSHRVKIEERFNWLRNNDVDRLNKFVAKATELHPHTNILQSLLNKETVLKDLVESVLGVDFDKLCSEEYVSFAELLRDKN